MSSNGNKELTAGKDRHTTDNIIPSGCAAALETHLKDGSDVIVVV